MKTMVREKVMEEPARDALGQSEIVSANDDGKFFLVTNNPITGGFFKAREHVKEAIFVRREAEARVSCGLLTLSAETESQIAALSTSVAQVLVFALYRARQKGYPDEGIAETAKSFMEARGGLKDRKEARKQLWEGIKALEKITVSFDVEKYMKSVKGRKLSPSEEAMKNLKSFPLLCGTLSEHQRSKYIPICFSPQFNYYLKQTLPMPYPSALLTANPYRYPLIFSLAYLIFSHKNMTSRFRKGEENANAQIRENVLSVKSLLDAVNLPHYKNATGTSLTNYRRDIIIPIERSLNFFSDTFTWTYCRARGATLDKDFHILPQNYDSLFVLFSFLNYIETPRCVSLKEPEGRRS